MEGNSGIPLKFSESNLTGENMHMTPECGSSCLWRDHAFRLVLRLTLTPPWVAEKEARLGKTVFLTTESYKFGLFEIVVRGDTFSVSGKAREQI